MTTVAAPVASPVAAGHFEVTDYDRQLFENHLRSFVPPDIFDAHSHLYRVVDLNGGHPTLAKGPQVAGYAQFVADQSRWMGDRAPREGLFFPIPTRPVDRPAANAFLRQEVQGRAGSRMLMLISPDDDPAQIERELDAHPWMGFKVYHVFAKRQRTLDADSAEFLPAWAWELAQARGLAIMLHMVRDRALGDPHNQHYIREQCQRYPQARLILAHAARAFCGYHTVEYLDCLRGLDNVWFDTSAVCEPQAFEAILREFGVSRLMYGGDYAITELRGRCISVADGFLWLDPNNTRWADGIGSQPTLVGIESLLALKQACRAARLNDSDVEQLFGGTARALLGIHPAADAATGPALYEQAKTIIPGGVQLFSKRPEVYAPQQWPAYAREAHGCTLVDLDGRTFIDMTTTGIGACLLGYNHPAVTDAVVRRVQAGAHTTLNSPDEPALARKLLTWHPWAGGVRFTRTGGESMAVAVRIARAHTGRDRVAFCGYHGWSDWYLAANLAIDGALDQHLLPGLSPAGVPAGLAGTAVPFAYNNFNELRAAVAQCGDRLAAIVMEPTRNADPAPGFLETARELAHASGAVLVMDEISAGFRLTRGGAHLRYHVEPDIAVFAKALGNGHPIGAVVGSASVMAAAQDSFISSTYWTEGVGFAAGLATMQVMEQVDVAAHAALIGTRFRQGLTELGQKHGVPVKLAGHPAITALGFDHPEAAALTTLLTVRMLRHGFLAGGSFYPSLAHEPRHVDRYLAAADEVFAELAQAIARGDVAQRIGGPVKQTGFARLT